MAYASIVSLMRTIDLLLTSESPIRSLICDHREEFLALHEKVSSLEVFVKNYEKSNYSGEMTDLEKQISEVANAVEHTIQLRLTGAAVAKDKKQKKKTRGRLRHSLQQVAKNIDRVWKESTKIQDEGKLASKESLVQDSSSEKHTTNVENNMVGRDDQRKRLLVELTQYGGSSSELKVIPIVGMGGIGKTTLAREVYNDVSIRLHFDVRAWATISQQHNVKEILLSLVHSTKGDSFYMEDEAELADTLQKSLKGKRYLIVLDDMWKSEAWDDARLCFPSENKGSRILLTTRDSEVACYASTENPSLHMGFMDPDESWNLFKSTVFENEALPSGFETIGRQIVDKCQGLPLTIVVVAGILSKSERTMEVWENVAKDIKSFVKNDPDKLCLHVLGLSYNHLTSDLKACLLYFGIFPEDSEISVKRLMRLWTAEGFLKLEKDLEGEAEKCLHNLIDRCLVLVSDKSLDESKIKSCKVHDLIYELCLRELTQSQNVLVMNDIVYGNKPNHIPPKCYLSGHTIQPSKRWEDDVIDRVSYRALLNPGHHHLKTDDDDKNLLKQTRSIFSSTSVLPTFNLQTFTLKSELIHFNLLRILDLSRVTHKNFPPQILSLIWLRYLVLCGCFTMPPEICRLWNLQTFIVDSSFTIFPEQIWELMQLRHLEVFSFYLPNPPSVAVDEEERYLEFSNIHTISGLSPSCCTKEVLSRIRNIKKLKICGDEDEYEHFQVSRLFENLVHLHQVETLSLKVCRGVSYEKSVTIPSAKLLPATIKKLKLYKTCLRWEDLNIIGELPNLEVLKLTCDAVKGQEWHPIVGGFTRLKLFLIDDNDLKYWKATDDSFPVLDRVVIRKCTYLEEIPIEFADIHSLQLIELKDCTPELEASAARIQQEQEDFGNKPADVRILESYSSDYAGSYCRVNKRYGFDSSAADDDDTNDRGEDFNSHPNKRYDADDAAADEDTDDHVHDFIAKMVMVVMVVILMIMIIQFFAHNYT